MMDGCYSARELLSNPKLDDKDIRIRINLGIMEPNNQHKTQHRGTE